jgi:hypothetical protein
LIPIFSATAIVLGILFLAVPNLELVTATFFLAGYFLGVRDGVISAVLGEFVYSLLNPLGTASPPLLTAQIIGMATVAFVGGTVATKNQPSSFYTQSNSEGTFSITFKHNSQISFNKKKVFFFGFLGFTLTLFFDGLTTISFLLFAGLTGTKFIVSIFYGLYFYLIHIGINTLIFALIIPILIPIIHHRLSMPDKSLI